MYERVQKYPTQAYSNSHSYAAKMDLYNQERLGNMKNCRRFLLEDSYWFLLEVPSLIAYLASPIFIAPMRDFLCLMSKLLANAFFFSREPQITITRSRLNHQSSFSHTTQKKLGNSILELNVQIQYSIKKSVHLCSFLHPNVLQLKQVSVPNTVSRKYYNGLI